MSIPHKSSNPHTLESRRLLLIIAINWPQKWLWLVLLLHPCIFQYIGAMLIFNEWILFHFVILTLVDYQGDLLLIYCLWDFFNSQRCEQTSTFSFSNLPSLSYITFIHSTIHHPSSSFLHCVLSCHQGNVLSLLMSTTQCSRPSPKAQSTSHDLLLMRGRGR